MFRQFRAPLLTVEYANFREFLSFHDGIVYCDSPYYSERGETERVCANKLETNVFSRKNHADLAELLKTRREWIASNHDCEWVRETYRDYEIHEVERTYSSSLMQSSDKKVNPRGQEVIIVDPL